MNNEKYKIFIAVINADKEKASSTESARDFLAVLQEHLLSYNKPRFVATMIHDKDTLESGELKTIHLHAFIEYSEKSTIKAILGELAEYLGIDKGLISLDGSNSEFLGVQYLTHKNDTNKYQYDFCEIKSTNSEILEQRYNDIYIDPQKKIYDALINAKSIIEFMSLTDPQTATKMRALFKEIKQEQKLDFELIYTEYERLSIENRELREILKDFFEDVERVANDFQKEAINLTNYKRRLYLIKNEN